MQLAAHGLYAAQSVKGTVAAPGLPPGFCSSYCSRFCLKNGDFREGGEGRGAVFLIKKKKIYISQLEVLPAMEKQTK